jgi:hypothetical protein
MAVYFPAFLLGCNNPTAPLSDGVSNSGNGTSYPPAKIRHAEIVPIPLTLDGPVSVRVTTESADTRIGTLRYRWFVNEKQVAVTNDGQMNPELLKRDDRVRVEVKSVIESLEGVPYLTAPVVVVNTPPSLKQIAFEPGQPKAGEKIQLKVDVVDPDQEEVRLKVKWWRNDHLVSEGEDAYLDTNGFERGDRIVASVIPRDSRTQGKEVFSQPYTLANGPPQFLDSGNPRVIARSLEHTVKAIDPENDPLTFFLETAPPGMTIEEKTGHIRWFIPMEAKGAFRVKVVVKDDHEGWASQELELTSPSGPASF